VATIYDHPRYYDILFGWDRSIEADFYERTFLRCGVGRDEDVLEVACGPGRVARLLARRGWRVAGLDSSIAMLEYFRARAAAERLDVVTLHGDMRTFSADRSFAAAFNPMSSIRLLHATGDAIAHLERVGTAIRPRGVYVLDLTFVDDVDARPVTTSESWEMSEGDVTVRADDERIRVNDAGRVSTLAWGVESHLRNYTPARFREVVAAASAFDVESIHPESGRATGVSEFALDPATSDPAPGRAMIVLRRR
jgi:SAM-dependent methyltransferase